MRAKPLSQLATRFLATDLNTVGDTTDVSVFRDIMQKKCQKLPTRAILGYSLIHVVFNQRHLLQSMVDKKAFLFKKPWVNWVVLRKVVAEAKANKQLVRSSNFYSVTLKQVVLQSGHSKVDKPTDPVARDLLACKLAGFDALPRIVCDLYDESPSRDLWKAMLLEWHQQVETKCSGAFGHYYMKCCLDRLFAVRRIDHGTISWWPTECPSYVKWYSLLFPNRQSFTAEEKFQILCAIYNKLNATRNSSFPDALAQTCWTLKEQGKRLALTAK